MKVRAWLILLLGVLALGGCGRELTAGGFREGEVSAVATDETRPSAPRFARAGEESAPRPNLANVGGLVRLTASVSLVAGSGALVPITDGAAAAEVGIGSGDSILLGRDSVPEGIYSAVRITFTDVVADVQGLLLAGVAFSGRVSVDLGTGPLVVEVPVPVTVREGVPSTVILELNSASWLSLAQLVPSLPPTARVSANALRDGISVRAE